MTRPVFLGEQTIPELQSLEPGQQVTLYGVEAHHLHVQRLTPNETCDLVDGRGLRVTAQVDEVKATVGRAENPAGTLAKTGKKHAEQSLTVVAVTRAPLSTPKFRLIQALCKNGRDEQAVEAAVELGVAAVQPWAAQRCIVQWKARKQQAGQEKWADLVVRAAKQARRAHWPQVEPLVDTKTLIKQVQAASAQGIRVLIFESEGEKNLLEWVRHSDQQSVEEVWLLVGPEGGISQTEIEHLVAAGAELVRLGGTILRASNAGPSALAVLTALTGYWDEQARC